MKRADLKAKMEKLGMEVNNELIDFILDENGKDIEASKKTNSSELAKLQEEVETLKTKNEELTTNASKYKDYEDLKKFKETSLAKEEENRKIEFLKSNGCKHPDLFVSKIDFTKGKYNDEKKTYEGLDESLKNVRETYKDMFDLKPGAQILNPSGGHSSAEQMSGVEAAFYKNNPSLMPKQN